MLIASSLDTLTKARPEACSPELLYSEIYLSATLHFPKKLKLLIDEISYSFNLIVETHDTYWVNATPQILHYMTKIGVGV